VKAEALRSRKSVAGESDGGWKENLATDETQMDTDFQSPSGWHICRLEIQNDSSSVGAEYAAPDGAGFVFGFWFYKDVAPTALSEATLDQSVSKNVSHVE
jgi:hypothetical protein